MTSSSADLQTYAALTNYSYRYVHCKSNKAIVDTDFARAVYSHHPWVLTDRPHRLCSEFSGFLFALAWRTEWSLLLHDANALQCIVSGEENIKNCIAPSPWDFVTLPEEDRATAIGNMHKNW